MTTYALDRDQEQVAAINITPLVDVMLVLLVIFMIAAPLVSQPIVLDSPGHDGERRTTDTPPIELRIDAAGEVYWNGNAMPLPALRNLLEAELARTVDGAPVLRVDASDEADYGIVAKVLAAARNAGVQRIAFVHR